MANSFKRAHRQTQYPTVHRSTRTTSANMDGSMRINCTCNLNVSVHQETTSYPTKPHSIQLKYSRQLPSMQELQKGTLIAMSTCVIPLNPLKY